MTRTPASERDTALMLAELVGVIGSPSFPTQFLAAMRALAGVDLCSVFRRDAAQPVQLLFAESALPMADFPIRASLEYARNYWRSDHQMTRLSRAGGKGVVVVRKRASEIADPAYRAACYDRAGIAERLSIVSPGASTLIANGYRTADSDPFSPGDVERLELYAGLLMAALACHDRAGAGAMPMFDETALVQSLMRLHCGLSSREAEISAAMILGETQDEIAARTHLSHSSVVTYRRRAYGKLGVANRRDLVRLHHRLAGGEVAFPAAPT
ncbi:LuxR family transcriptional regulator [Sphingomonas gei]|uniref:LuxR family transcriptional regulator n=1 Tax=Sphingomonas gei TaxID=1395960 RepID=A0A4S1XD29_9SPHN|nr:helix-turn-helix transcriptional regulator [Sphingomonas gei]TGX54379.1 LuxR family transcriptional regulator [Sphingomonas gei]